MANLKSGTIRVAATAAAAASAAAAVAAAAVKRLRENCYTDSFLSLCLSLSLQSVEAAELVRKT